MTTKTALPTIISQTLGGNVPTNTTKTAQFTPGPWEVNQSDVAIIGVHKEISPGVVLPIAEVQYNPSRQPWRNGEHIANAALIAAAPAMYEALQQLLTLTAPLMLRDGSGPVRCTAAAMRTEAALAQAEGK